MPKAPSTARLIASVVLIQDGKALLLNEPDDNGNLKQNLPGGHVEPNESLVEAAQRETKEETGYDIRIGSTVQLISSSWNDGTHSVRQTFLGDILGGELHTEDGSTAHWLSRAEIEATDESAFVFGVKEALLLAFDKTLVEPHNIIMRKNGERVQ